MRRRASECWLAVVLLVSGILHGEGVAACGAGFIAARPAEGSVVARGAARPGAWVAGRERGSATPLRAWRPRGTGSGRAQSALGGRAAPAPPGRAR